MIPSLYIRRAEVFHTEEYIKNAFSELGYGIVSETVFIKKINDLGHEYCGVIVHFENYFSNEKVRQLMACLKDESATARIIHDAKYHRYWIVNKHVEMVSKPAPNYNTISTETIGKTNEELQEMIRGMAFQMRYLQTQLEKTESQMMDLEYVHVRDALINADLLQELEHKYQEVDDRDQQISQLYRQLDMKTQECEELKETVYEEQSIMQYVEKQASEMRSMLYSGFQTTKPTRTVEEL